MYLDVFGTSGDLRIDKTKLPNYIYVPFVCMSEGDEYPLISYFDVKSRVPG